MERPELFQLGLEIWPVYPRVGFWLAQAAKGEPPALSRGDRRFMVAAALVRGHHEAAEFLRTVAVDREDDRAA